MTALLTVKNLSYDYPDGTPALRGLSLDLEEGAKMAVVGSNGSGKSTLLLHLAGCFAPQRGEISLRGKAVGENLQALKDAIGMVFQEPDDQLFMPSVAMDAAFGLIARKVKPESALATAQACLERLGIAHLANRPPHRLSSGEKRLAAIAGILAMNPEIILLDEPSAALDPRARRQLISILKGLGKSMIIATHDLEMAKTVCDSAIVIQSGRVAAEGSPDKLLGCEKLLEECGL
ncbi:MAG: energy-coupling factor ABC transporter ATP-binding protein [Synergistaceae bacterium]|jgi:cobalt/nickel transport system ATP-binding protein|nr:energy-coupling factor ABC transporter ATP-binding protein [Synergistaceae bacterium]